MSGRGSDVADADVDLDLDLDVVLDGDDDVDVDATRVDALAVKRWNARLRSTS